MSLGRAMAAAGHRVIVISELKGPPAPTTVNGIECRYVAEAEPPVFWKRISFRLLFGKLQNRLRRATMDIANDVHIDELICVHRPIAPLLAALSLSMSLRSTRVTILLLDFAMETLPSNPIGRHLRRAQYRRLYSRAWHAAHRVVAMSFFRSAIDPFCQVAGLRKPAYIELPLLYPSPTMNLDADTDDPRPAVIRVVYVGTFSPRWRSPVHMLTVLSGCLAADDRLELHLYSSGCEEDVERFAAIWPERLIVHGLVSPDEARMAVNTAQVLINVSNDLPNSVPGKIWEYFASGLPIITFCSRRDDPSLVYLHKYPLGLILSGGSPNDIPSTLSFLANHAGSRIPFQQVEQIFPENLPSRAAALLLSNLAAT